MGINDEVKDKEVVKDQRKKKYGLRVELSDGSKILVRGVKSVAELESYLRGKMESEEFDKKCEEFEEYLEETGDYRGRAKDIPNREIHEVMREDMKRGGGPGGTEPTGESKDKKIMWNRMRKDRYRENGSWNDNL